MEQMVCSHCGGVFPCHEYSKCEYRNRWACTCPKCCKGNCFAQARAYCNEKLGLDKIC